MYTKAINISVLFLFLILSKSIFSQNIEIQKNQKINIDHLGNVYIIDEANLSLISNKNKIEYQNNFLGDIYSIDLSNPLRILVFHKDANQIVYLNNELSIIGNAINLDELTLPDVAVVCGSQINGFWLFNNLNNRIEFYNSNLQKIHTSLNLSQYIDSPENIQNIIMSRERIYLQVKNTGILVFDMFASYIKTIPITSNNSIQVMENSILYTKGNQAIVYDFEKLEHNILFQAKSNIQFARVYNSSFYYLENNILHQENLTGTQKK